MGEYTFLYPQLSQENFNIKIAEKREFYDTRYPEITHDDIEKYGNFLCNEKEFELLPHQLFVRNFLSVLTPYNSLLLYHGLGSGKTCSAITVCEEARDYHRQINRPQKIWVVAAPNVRENFKLQLFDERKLKKINGLWNLRACTGNKYLKEINPMSLKNLSRERIIQEVKRIIKTYYTFLGYVEFSNLIEKIRLSVKGSKARERILREKFSDGLIVIDEVHNIRHSADNPKKKVGINLLRLVQIAQNLKLLFLSATPMYNSHEEILWLLNIMNINDGRPPIIKKEIFDNYGNFVVTDSEEVGKMRLTQAAIGYISYIRGNNPYTFPYRIWPALFNENNSLIERAKINPNFYPTIQLNGTNIIEPIQHIDLFLVSLKLYQLQGYQKIISYIIERLSTLKSSSGGLGYEILESALQGLNIIFPQIEEIEEPTKTNITKLYGYEGLLATMNFNSKLENFTYKNNIKQKFGNFFAFDRIREYSTKIFHIMKAIKKSKGIVIIYSQYIHAGCIPVALALEELGFTRYGRSSLFKTAPHPPIDYRTLTEKKGDLIPAQYAMITGNVHLTPNKKEMKAITDINNKHGEKIKVVIISRAGSEGIDFKNIRQVHILDPWYNLNRPEQVIGRAVRNCSHKALPFRDRNVEIYMYAALQGKKSNVETADLYIYRKAEIKAKKIGEVSRLLKQISVDCVLNTHYNNLSLQKRIPQMFSTKRKTVLFDVASKPFSVLCDFMEKCNYSCNKGNIIGDINNDTYSEEFIIMNTEKIIQRIREIVKKQFVFKRIDLIARIRANKHYPLMQIDMALNQLVNDKNIFLSDMFGRLGHLVNIDEYYMFQPLGLSNKHSSRYTRSSIAPDFPQKILIQIPKQKSRISQRHIISNFETFYNCITDRCTEDDYKILPEIIDFLSSVPFNIPRDTIVTFLMQSFFDKLTFEEKKMTTNAVWTNEDMHRYKLFIEPFIITSNGKKLLPLIKVKQKKMIGTYLLYKNEKWNEITKEERIEIDYEPSVKRKFKINLLSKIIGFMGMDKNKNIKFKVAYPEEKSFRNKKGFQCITQQKIKTIALFNKLFKISPIPSWKTIVFSSKEGEGIHIKRGFSRTKLCIIEELIFQYYNSIDKTQIWFLTSFGTFYSNIET